MAVGVTQTLFMTTVGQEKQSGILKAARRRDEAACSNEEPSSGTLERRNNCSFDTGPLAVQQKFQNSRIETALDVRGVLEHVAIGCTETQGVRRADYRSKV
jgi:hypothetical protein